jgi:dipeptidyl aminopeptidase/acylaminoacyl peptidase
MQRRVFPLLVVVGMFACSRDVAGPTLTTPRVSQTVLPPPPADPAIAYGSAIAYASRHGKGFTYTYGLAVMNADGTNQTTIAPSVQASHPAWSPDGHSIAYHPTNYGISRVDVSVVNGVPQASAPVTLPITHESFDIAWSPDATNPQIAYSENLVNVGDLAGVYLAPASPMSPYVENQIYLGPPNNRMIWIAWNPQATRIAVIQRSTSAAVDSLFLIDVATKSATFVRSFIRGVAGLSWSRTAPDRLALAVPLPNNAGFQPSILDLTTNTLSNAPSGLFAKWSPDDSRLVYISSTNSGEGPIYAVTLSTGAQVKLAADGFEPEWRRNP